MTISFFLVIRLILIISQTTLTRDSKNVNEIMFVMLMGRILPIFLLHSYLLVLLAKARSANKQLCVAVSC